MKQIKFLFLFVVTLLSTAAMRAQTTASGTVVDNQGEPIIGASVVQQGSSKGTITDLNGHFTVSVPDGSSLVISYIGYVTKTVKAGSDIRVTLLEDQQTIDDVVVIGYGVQKKSVVTAAIAKVTSDDLAGKSPVRVDNALKGLAAGVQVTSASGQPGAAPRVLIRGVGTINDATPLYIIDGMPVGGGGLDYLSPDDIASIEVLKDAASAAIYGTRGANGVILVTTKKGNIGKAQINYNFSYGWQNAAKKRKVAGATDYAIMQNEMHVNAGQAPVYADPYNLTDSNGDPITGQGWDWQDMVFNKNAPISNHDVNISGATDKLNYYLSLSFFTQEGIVGGDHGQSNYNRLTLRSNNSYNLIDATKERNFLNKLDLTVNLAYSRIKNTGVTENSEFGSILGSALYMSPLLAPTVTDPDAAAALRAAFPDNVLINDANGNPYSIPSQGGTYQESNNPLALMQIPPTKNWSHHFVANFGIGLNIWDNLKYHFSYGADMSFWGNDGGVESLYYLSGNNKQVHTSATMEKRQNVTWSLENTLSYDKTIGKHSFDIVLGQSALKYSGSFLTGWRWGLVNPAKKYINYTNSTVIVDPDTDAATVPYGVDGGANVDHTLSSLFARVSYNYDERYMLQATLRRDGSSRFGANYKYGYFPAVSVGWNITNEDWLRPSLPNWLTSAKLRLSWGKNGNENIPEFGYTAMSAMGNNYLFGRATGISIGSKANRLANPDLHWEQSEQTDIGLDLGFLDNALTFTVDYYSKKTKGMIIDMPIPGYVGETAPLANVGDMTNSGVEFEAGYRWNVGEAQFSVKGNASYLHNVLTRYGDNTGFRGVDGVQGYTGNPTAALDGLPYPFFYGYKTAGVFQTMDDVHSYVNKDGGMLQPDAKPGYVKFVDTNEDGVISDDDRTDIGNGTPTWTYGFNFNAAWKGFDISLFLQGVGGADVFDATHRTDILSGNFPSWMLDRWTGPGTSNKYPLLSLNDATNWQTSDLYVCDGSYMRIKNIELGYTLPKLLTRKIGVERFRLFVMAENLVTFTKYWGFDPEMSSGSGESLGLDRGVYPQARTWTVGFNVSF